MWVAPAFVPCITKDSALLGVEVSLPVPFSPFACRHAAPPLPNALVLWHLAAHERGSEDTGRVAAVAPLRVLSPRTVWQRARGFRCRSQSGYGVRPLHLVAVAAARIV